VRVFEDQIDWAGNTFSRSGPFFQSFDFRTRYTGIKKTTISTSHHVTFANSAKPTADSSSFGVIGQVLTANTSSDYGQSWLALYSAMCVNYALTPQLSLFGQVGFRNGIITSIYNDYETVRSNFQVGGALLAVFVFHRNVSIEGGLAIRHWNDSYTNTAAGAQSVAATRNASGGTLDISIPISMIFIMRKGGG